jgi:hypothetical protein
MCPALHPARARLTATTSLRAHLIFLTHPPTRVRPLPCADKSSIYMDPAAASDRLNTSHYLTFGKPQQPSYLAESNRTWGNLRRTACTRPTPSPAFYPPDRNATVAQIGAADYNWKWPVREKRAAAPQIQRPEKVEQSFLEEYELRPPWLKY